MSGDNLNKVSMRLRGPAVTIADTIEAGRALANLLNTVAESLGAPADAPGFEITAVTFCCDGCGATRPDRPAAGEGWTHSDGDDFCPTCSAARVPVPAAGAVDTEEARETA